MPFQRFKERLKEYFTFTRKERNGILMLLILMLLMQAAIIYTHFMKPATNAANIQKFNKELLAFENEMNATDSVKSFEKHDALVIDTGTNKTPVALVDFDPNIINEDQWKRFGLDGRTINAITNYTGKGGRFYKKEDLRKIYTLKEKDFLKLEPFIVINEKENKSETIYKAKNTEQKQTLPIIELNKATKEELMSLPMIGEKRADQIIRYRDLLGGFVLKEQLKEVYSIPDSVYQRVIPGISVNDKLVKYININADSSSALKHLYIKQPIAKLIVNYRLQHGNYHSVEDLRKLPLMTDSLFRKIEPYLAVD